MMNSRDLQIAFLVTSQNKKFFQNVGPVANTGFSSYDHLHTEWEQKLSLFESKYMLVFVEDMKRKSPGQKCLPLKPEFINRLVKDKRLGHVIFTLDGEGFNGLPEPKDDQFLRYWYIDVASSSENQISEAVTQYRLEFSEWL